MTSSPTDLPFEQAAQHWARRQSGKWTAGDERRLNDWLAASAENRAAYERVAGIWATAGNLEREAFGPPMPRRVLTGRRVAQACAVVLVCVVGIPAWLYASRWWNGVPVHWITPRGESKTMQLKDGTQVLLDADSDLVTKLGAHVRRVSLVKGEALFTVTHDASRPFIVEIGRGRVIDLGTRFAVEKLSHAVRVTVFEGRVGIHTPQGEVVLAGGHGGGYSDTGELRAVSKVDADAMLRADGERHFDSEPLAAVVEKFARYHPVTFAFSDPQLQDLRVSGTFRMADLTLFLRTLTAALPIDARWTDLQHVEFVSRAAPQRKERRLQETSAQ